MMVYSKSYAHSNRNKVSAHDSGLIGNVCFFLSPTKSPLQVLILASYESSGAEIENCRTQFMNEDLFGKPKGMLHSTQCGATVAYQYSTSTVCILCKT